jgi:phytoene dehydrogenase-like protein
VTALLGLLGAHVLTPTAEHRLRGWRCRGTTAQIDLALSGPLRFRGREETPIERARITGSLDDVERAFDAAKYGELPARPALEVYVPTVANPEWAPAGGHVVSMLAHFAPYGLRGEWSAEARGRLADAALTVLARHAPGVEALVTARDVLAPPDIERRYGVTGGHVLHGDHALDQLVVRPSPECARYATPVRGLLLCGSGTHPGSRWAGVSGWLAARRIGEGRL